MFYNVVKNEMLIALSQDLVLLTLKYQDGSDTSLTAIEETQLWNAPANGAMTQNATVDFAIDTTGGEINIAGFNLILVSVGQIAMTYNSETIYSYPNNGTFTIDGASIVLN